MDKNFTENVFTENLTEFILPDKPITQEKNVTHIETDLIILFIFLCVSFLYILVSFCQIIWVLLRSKCKREQQNQDSVDIEDYMSNI